MGRFDKPLHIVTGGRNAQGAMRIRLPSRKMRRPRSSSCASDPAGLNRFRGQSRIRLAEKYSVKLSFPGDKEGAASKNAKPDEVTIRGGRKRVAAAKSQLLEAAAYETESRQSLTFTVPSKAVASIVGKPERRQRHSGRGGCADRYRAKRRGEQGLD